MLCFGFSTMSFMFQALSNGWQRRLLRKKIISQQGQPLSTRLFASLHKLTWGPMLTDEMLHQFLMLKTMTKTGFEPVQPVDFLRVVLFTLFFDHGISD